MCSGLTRKCLPSCLRVAWFMVRHRLDRLHHGVADEVGEGDLAATGALQVVVDHHAVVDQQLRRNGAHAGRGRHGRARRPCCHDQAETALEGDQLGTGRGGRGRHVLAVLRGIGLLGRDGGRAADGCGRSRGLRRHRRGRRSGDGLVRRRRDGCGRRRDDCLRDGGRRRYRRGCCGGGRCRRRGGRRGLGGCRHLGSGSGTRLVIGEEVPPGPVDGLRVLEVLLVDLVDEPLVGAEPGIRVGTGTGVCGSRAGRGMGGLWRHGGNRPLPLPYEWWTADAKATPPMPVCAGPAPR